DPALAADPALTTGPAINTATGPTLATSAARFFGPLLVPQKDKAFGLDQADVLTSDDRRFTQLSRVYYGANVVNNDEPIYGDGTTYGGTQLLLATKFQPLLMLYIRYYVRFPADFDWVKGGNLPGLYGVNVKDGKISPGDGGFAVRIAWRKKGYGAVNAYLPNAPNHLKTFAKNAWAWNPGVWTCVELGLRLNTPGLANGAASVWIDNAPAYHEQNLELRVSDKPHIGGLAFTTYFGGGDLSWEPPFSQSADFAGFAVGPARIGPIAAPRPAATQTRAAVPSASRTAVSPTAAG
ncbi:MAG: polysaccharide lyase, partial [Frankia sp.]